MHVFGITGSIGTGKSTVCNIIEEVGYKVISADKIINFLYQPGNKGYKAIMTHFTSFINGKEVDRDALSSLIFQNEDAKEFLESLIHPLVMEELQTRLLKLEEDGFESVFVEMPLLFEAKFDKYFTKNIVVTCEESKLVKRIVSRGKHTKEQALAFINNQMPQEKKTKKADFEIKNDGSQKDLKIEVNKILEQLK